MQTGQKPEPRRPDAGPLRVLCVDDNDLVCDALRVSFQADPGFEWVGAIATADGLVEEVRKTRPDAVLMDLDMPGADPMEELRRLGAECPQARIIIFTGHVRRELVDKAFDAGVWGYLSKNESTQTVMDAIRRVLADEVVVGPDVAQVNARH